MSTTKKVIIAIMVIIAIAGITFGAVWVGTNWDKITSQTNLYTYEEMVDFAEDKNQEMQDDLDNYKLLYEETIKKMSEMEDDKNELVIQVANLQKNLEEAQKENEINNETIIELNSAISSLSVQVSTLEDQLEELQTNYNEIFSENTELNEMVVSLSNQVTELSAQLEAFENMNLDDYYKVEFINSSNDVVVSSSYLLEGSALTIPTIANTFETWFYGWTTERNSEVVFDFTNFVVDNDYTFYSVLGDTVPVRLETDDKEKYCYYYGERLTVRDVLVIDSNLDLDDENIELIFAEGVSLDTVITDLPEKGYLVDGRTKRYVEYTLSIDIKYNHYTPEAHYGVEVNETSFLLSGSITDELDYNYNILSISDLSFTIHSEEEGFTDTQQLTISTDIITKTSNGLVIFGPYQGKFAGYNFTLKFALSTYDDSYAFQFNFESFPNNNDYQHITVDSFTIDFKLIGYFSMLDGAVGEELPLHNRVEI